MSTPESPPVHDHHSPAALGGRLSRAEGDAHGDAPPLLLTARDEEHPFDDYLGEALLTEGYACCEHISGAEAVSAATLEGRPLVLCGSGAALHLPQARAEGYLRAGGRMVVIQPPRDWAPLLGLAAPGPLYAEARDACLRINGDCDWLAGFPERDLQCPGTMHVYPLAGAAPAAWLAGQLGYPSIYPALAAHAVGAGRVVTFTYDLAACLVILQQGRAEFSSTGLFPDANRDGKFCANDALDGIWDFRLRHVPQADLHRDLLVRAIRALTADLIPLPRLWHFPDAAPAVLFVDGDGDSMIWEDMEAAVGMAEAENSRYTCYLMDEQIAGFRPEALAELRRRGHEFGVHPWVGPQPNLAEWEAGIADIVGRFTARFGFRPVSLRSHSCIFPGWDETPAIFLRHGLRLDTSFAPGYRYMSGYVNGSALPLRFVDRQGSVIDCWEQSTVQTEDGALTPKCLLPPLTVEQGLALACDLIRRAAADFHGVFHPYFHPVSLGGRRLDCAGWFRGVLREARARGLPTVNATQWLEFNDARRQVQVDGLRGGEGHMEFTLRAAEPPAGLTILMPPCAGHRPVRAAVDGQAVEVRPVPFEGLGWSAVQCDLRRAEALHVTVEYG